ncbi:hypothetical protein BJ875DRAFT_438057 [Amylocarpus encephaloides]|uniref:Uncharacterized protein n=1 Tax=Amylocarpus encephaloides TaxID=45428 RepID=A0A9P7YQI0_9HELO|nr:hypothetical protein BJ875DRAFT_438057 [Amylocarpus encephaloides]
METEVRAGEGPHREEGSQERIPFVIFGTQDRPNNASQLDPRTKSFMRDFPISKIPPLKTSGSLQEVPPKAAPTKDTEPPRALISNELPSSLGTPGGSPSNSQRPSIKTAESETVVEHARELHNWGAKEEKETSFSGIGKNGPHNAISDRFARFSSVNSSPAAPRGHKARVPSWRATVTPAEEKIDMCVLQIVKFIRNLYQQSKLDDQAMSKLFFDANREIVRSWPYHDDAPCKNPSQKTLCEKVDLIHATLIAYDAATKDDVLMEKSQELAERCIEFGKEWESSTRRDLGVAKACKDGEAQELEEEIAENNETMEYIAPHSGTKLRDNGGDEEDACKFELPDPKRRKKGPPSKSKPRSKSLANQPSKSTPSTIPEEHHFSHNIISETLDRELQKIGHRLDQIVHSVQPNNLQDVIKVLEMHAIMLQDIRCAIVGDDSKVRPDTHAERSANASAKSTGLLMLSKYLVDWKDDCGSKIDRIESGVNAIYDKDADAINGNLMESCGRIEEKLNTLESHLPTTSDGFTQRTTSLEAEKAKLAAQLEKLQIEHEERRSQAEVAKGEVQRLQGEVQGLEHGFRTVISKLAELQNNAEVKSDPAAWIDEAWDSAMDGFWPQGDPSVPAIGESEREDGKGTKTGASTIMSTKPQVKKARRANGSGTGTGACVIL